MEVKPPLTLYFIPLNNPPLLTLLLLPTTTTMSSTLSHSMENDLMDNAFLAMMLPLLEESQEVSKPRQSRNIDREDHERIKAAFRMNRKTFFSLRIQVVWEI